MTPETDTTPGAPDRAGDARPPLFDADTVLAALALEEKAALLCGHDDWFTAALDGPGLPHPVPAIELGDGPHGLRKETGVDMVWVPATCFPTASALGASWDRDLVRRVGAALAREATAEGVQVLLGPGVNMKRSPLCGRSFEYFSEDPVLSGEIGAAYVSGVQSEGVGATLKHLAVNNQETERTRISVEVGERALRELYLPAFERVVTSARPWAVMCSYNRIRGVHASQSWWLLTGVLRDEWGFDGVVVSDWDAVHDRVAALRAGLDLEMPGTGGATEAEIVAAVGEGSLEEAVVDAAAGRVLRLVARAHPGGSSRGAVLDLGHRPGEPLTARQLGLLGADEHHALAREAAGACITLLRNERGENGAPALPLSPEDGRRIAVVGAYAERPRIQGGGSSGVEPTRVDGPLDAIRAIAGSDVRYAPGYAHRPLNAYQDDVDALLGDHGIAFRDERTGPARRTAALTEPLRRAAALRRSLLRPPSATALRLAEVRERTGAVLVVVLSNGSAITMDPWHDRVDALVEAWLPGQAGGAAIADVLFGRANPSGRLSETFPLRLADTPGQPAWTGERGTVVYGEGVFIGYRWYDALERAVRYPFGHGLSYTAFRYDGLEVAVDDAASGVVRVSCSVTNAGERAGSEVVQLYVADPDAEVRRPPRELKGFEKVALAPGGSARVEFLLGGRDFSYWDEAADPPGAGAWRREGGEFRIDVGASSRDIRLSATVVLPDDPREPPLVPDAELGRPSA